MQKKSIQEIEQIYNLELPKIISTINSKKPFRIRKIFTKDKLKVGRQDKMSSSIDTNKSKPLTVLLQFPEGLKPYAQTITDYLESKTNAQFIIWLDTCFGACDIPIEVEKLGVDLIIQFGHSEWKY